MYRHAPGIVRRGLPLARAARTGPNSDIALVFIWRKGMPPQTEVWPYARIEQLAAAVTEEEVRAEIGRSSGTGEAGSPE
ncbi:MAG: hypothetical protein M5U12_17410 [Verrucomicrobia bacterium]|nr:hypothetical protein [Verrucomicrobiota bacterium]